MKELSDALFTIAVIAAGFGGVVLLLALAAPLVSGLFISPPDPFVPLDDDAWREQQLAADAAERGE